MAKRLRRDVKIVCDYEFHSQDPLETNSISSPNVDEVNINSISDSFTEYSGVGNESQIISVIKIEEMKIEEIEHSMDDDLKPMCTMSDGDDMNVNWPKVPPRSIKARISLEPSTLLSLPKGIQQFECVFCHRDWKHKSNLLRHLRKHTEQKSFSCDVCSKHFSRKSK